MKKKIGNSWGVGGLYMTPLERKFRGGGGSNRKNHPWGGGGMDIFWNPTITVSYVCPLFFVVSIWFKTS